MLKFGNTVDEIHNTMALVRDWAHDTQNIESEYASLSESFIYYSDRSIEEIAKNALSLSKAIYSNTIETYVMDEETARKIESDIRSICLPENYDSISDLECMVIFVIEVLGHELSSTDLLLDSIDMCLSKLQLASKKDGYTSFLEGLLILPSKNKTSLANDENISVLLDPKACLAMIV